MTETTVTPTSLSYHSRTWVAYAKDQDLSAIDCRSVLTEALEFLRAQDRHIWVSDATSSSNSCYLTFLANAHYDTDHLQDLVGKALARSFPGIVFDVHVGSRDCM